MVRILRRRRAVVKRDSGTSLGSDHTRGPPSSAIFFPKRVAAKSLCRDLTSPSARRLHWLCDHLRFMPELRGNSPFLKRPDENEAGK